MAVELIPWKRSMFKRLTENPILAGAALVTTILSALASFVTTLGIPPFLADLTLAGGVFAVLTYWLIGAIRGRKGAGSTKLYGPNGERLQNAQVAADESPYTKGLGVLVVPVLLGVLVWDAVPVIGHLVSPDWTFCATVTAKPGIGFCTSLLDGRRRDITGDCYRSSDDSGYVRLPRPHWWTYRPARMVVKQDKAGEFGELLLPNFFEPVCTGKVILP